MRGNVSVVRNPSVPARPVARNTYVTPPSGSGRITKSEGLDEQTSSLHLVPARFPLLHGRDGATVGAGVRREGRSMRKLSRQKRWAVACYQRGGCINCGKPRGSSPYKRHCSKCAIKHRVRMERKKNMRPWRPGGRGRPPLIKVVANVKQVSTPTVVQPS